MIKIKRKHVITGVLLLLLFMIWINNTSLFYDKTRVYKFIAHRGLAQNFDISEVKWDTDTSKIIFEPEHDFLENTMDSINIAFDYGADVVELDIQLTKDKKMALFHDFELSYRTNAKGEIINYTMSELKLLDIGYGYTADNGKTYPFKGKGIGLMPELTEVLTTFPDEDFLIHLKDTNIETAKVLWEYIKGFPPERLNKFTVYGFKDGVDYLREQSKTLKVMSKNSLKQALLKYELMGFTGYIPKEIHNTEIHIPLSYAKFLWGWPNKFIERMDSVNTRVVIVAGNGEWSEGFDSLESIEKIPLGYTGYVWTNRIDKVSKVTK